MWILHIFFLDKNTYHSMTLSLQFLILITIYFQTFHEVEEYFPYTENNADSAGKKPSPFVANSSTVKTTKNLAHHVIYGNRFACVIFLYNVIAEVYFYLNIFWFRNLNSKERHSHFKFYFCLIFIDCCNNDVITPTSMVSFLLVTKYRSGVAMEDLRDAFDWLKTEIENSSGYGYFV